MSESPGAMLVQNPGAACEVWDGAVRSAYGSPAEERSVRAFSSRRRELVGIRRTLQEEPATDRRYTAELVGEGGEVHATAEIVVHVRKSEETG